MIERTASILYWLITSQSLWLRLLAPTPFLKVRANALAVGGLLVSAELLSLVIAALLHNSAQRL